MALLIRNPAELRRFLEDHIEKTRKYRMSLEDPEIRAEASGCLQGLQIALSGLRELERNEQIKEAQK